MTKRVFEIEWRDDLGPMWMNEDNLAACLKGGQHCGEGTITRVSDVTGQYVVADQPDAE